MGDSSDDFRSTDIWRRPQTEELVDVHVYVVPSAEWIEQRKLAKRDIIDQAISSGFVRIIPSTTLLELRSEIREQLGTENVPEAYVFLRNVGRNFTQVKSKQELELKIKSFLPPFAEEPEIYVKEGEFTAFRSASVGVSSRTTKLTSSASTPATSSSESQTDILEDRGFLSNILRLNRERRALSLDRRQNRLPMTSEKPVSSQKVPQSRTQRTSRPPTPRVNDRFFIKTNKYRSSSIASKMNESIQESPTEQVEEIRTPVENLKIETDSERVLNSPPPRPASETSKRNPGDIELPIPTPTPTFIPPESVRQLQSKFEELRAERRLRELKRDALMQKVRDLQKRKASSKDRAREEWKRRYQEVRKATPRLEDHCSKLRQELEKLVKDMLVSVKTDRDSQPHKPSKKTSYKIMIMRLLQEVEELKRRLQSVTIRLNAETKLRSHAEFEVKKLRQDLLHKKTQVTLTRKQTAFPQTSEQFFISAV